MRSIQSRLRDSDAILRWTQGELYSAISDAVLRWSGRVAVPYVYTVTGGWSSGVYEYALPIYMGRRIQPQRKVSVPYVSEGQNSQYVWADVLGWEVEPDGSGGQVLRLAFNEGNTGSAADGRILWWGENGPLPRSASTGYPQANHTLGADVTANDSYLTLDGRYFVPQVGYISLGNQWLQYNGYSTVSGATRLLNLVWAIDGTEAASVSSGAAVLWGVAMPVMSLLENLYNQALANAYAYSLTDVNESDRQRQEWNMRYYQQMADEFWQRWTPNVAPRLKLSRRAMI